MNFKPKYKKIDKDTNLMYSTMCCYLGMANNLICKSSGIVCFLFKGNAYYQNMEVTAWIRIDFMIDFNYYIFW